jgi:hypothetical protein
MYTVLVFESDRHPAILAMGIDVYDGINKFGALSGHGLCMAKSCPETTSSRSKSLQDTKQAWGYRQLSRNRPYSSALIIYTMCLEDTLPNVGEDDRRRNLA